MIVAIDLAAKYSAMCIIDESGKVIQQLDSWQLSEDEFLDKCVESFEADNVPRVMVVEDTPQRLPFMTVVKKVCRLHGRIEEKMFRLGHRDKVVFVPPATWQRSYEGVFKGGKDAAATTAESMGYIPPHDFTEFKGKDRQTARKVNSDYCDAFLIAHWAKKVYTETGTFDANTTSRFIKTE